jgi:hypothetical protein
LLVLKIYLEHMNNSHDYEVALVYRNLAELLEQASDEYEVLVSLLAKQANQK